MEFVSSWSSGKKTALLLRGPALIGAGLEAAGRIAAKSGARLLCDTFAPHAEFGAGRVPVERIPYFAEQIAAFLASTQQVILSSFELLVGSRFLPRCDQHATAVAARTRYYPNEGSGGLQYRWRDRWRAWPKKIDRWG